MPHDPVRIEETRSWFRKASDDLRAASVDMGAEPPLIEDALFHCQQAVEKAMKGFLAWHDQPFRKTHSLTELGLECSRVDPTLENTLRQAACLSEYATVYRYPGEVAPPSEEEADNSYRLAKDVVSLLLARLPADVTP